MDADCRFTLSLLMLVGHPSQRRQEMSRCALCCCNVSDLYQLSAWHAMHAVSLHLGHGHQLETQSCCVMCDFL